MTFYLHEPATIGRTIFETDCRLFASIMNSEFDSENVDRRLLIMLTTGLLNRSLNLESYLVAALGQNWNFLHHVHIGQTISCEYKVELLKEQKKVYEIRIKLFAESKVVATGIWTVMLKQLLN